MIISTTSPQPPVQGVLRIYFAMLFAAVFMLMTQFWHFADSDGIGVRIYIVAATGGYASLYTLSPLALTTFIHWLTRRFSLPPRWQQIVTYPSAILGASLTLLFIYADYQLYELYEYHFNGFVWNLITTPGGIDALGATASTMQTIALWIVLLVAATTGALALLHRYLRSQASSSPRPVMAATAAMLTLLVSTEGVFAYSTYTGQEKYIQAAEVIPFHLRTSTTALFGKLGIERSAMKNLRIAGGKVNYPAAPIEAAPRTSYPNIIMLVGESFRWDLLDPEITPNLWQLSKNSLRFSEHYSGGNRTRMGLFSMFYGLYSPYWYSFERQRVAPVLMDFLRDRNYQLALHTSQSFDYPELRHTVFTGVPEQHMQEIKTGEPWQRDRQNISDIIAKLEHRDRQRPFYGFMFFESTHAPYTFPDTAVIRTSYEKDLNYIKMNLQQNIEQIHARYINAAHHIDQEVGRLIAHLKQSGMMDNTIVLFTGDHGEEFMEKGHWGHGHNRSFPEEQIRVPLVMHIPGKPAEVIEHRTSHLQIAPTLLGMLGVKTDPRHYSSAGSLFDPAPYFVAGDYNYMTVFDTNFKISFPFTGSDFFRYTVLDAEDHPVVREKKEQVIAQYQASIETVIAESRRFVR
jgi:membrane-anchored protein YejM (alkaline phosphatase superfamily)